MDAKTFRASALSAVIDQFTSPVAAENWVLLKSETLDANFKIYATKGEIEEYFLDLLEQERNAVDAGFEPKPWEAASSIKPGRPVGFSPINGEGGAMIKKNKAWSMPADHWEWLEAQPNQSEVIRQAIIVHRNSKNETSNP